MHAKGPLLPVNWALVIGLTAFTLRVRLRGVDWHDVRQRTLRAPRYLWPPYLRKLHERAIERENQAYDLFFAKLRGTADGDKMLVRGGH